MSLGSSPSNMMHSYITMGNIQQVANLIENGADVNQQAGGGETPLHAASKRGNMAITVLLLLNKANPNIVDVFSKTPLHYAAREGKIDVVKALLDNGADINAKTHTALHEAVIGSCEEVVQTLVENGADTTLRNHNGQTAIDLAKTEKIQNILRHTHILLELPMRKTLSPVTSPTTSPLSRTTSGTILKKDSPKGISTLNLGTTNLPVGQPLLSLSGAHTSRDGSNRPFFSKIMQQEQKLKPQRSAPNLLDTTFSVTTIVSPVTPQTPIGSPKEDELRQEIKELRNMNNRLRQDLVDEKRKVAAANEQVSKMRASNEKLVLEHDEMKRQLNSHQKDEQRRTRHMQLLLIKYLINTMYTQGELSEHAIEQVENMRNAHKPPRLVKVLCDKILHHVAILNTSYKYRIQGMLDFDEQLDQDETCLFYEGSESLKSLHTLQQEPVNTKTREVLLVDPISDQELLTFVEQLRNDLAPVTDLKKAYVQLSQAIDTRMGRVSERAHFGSKEHIIHLKQEIQSNVIPIGLIRKGTSRHRSILFKFLCDKLRSEQIPLKCRLVEGERGTKHAWNVVVRDGQMYIIDLIDMPGVMFPEGSREADDYKRGSFTGNPSKAPFVRGWLRPIDVNNDVYDRNQIGSGGYGKVFSVVIPHEDTYIRQAMKVVNLSMMTKIERDKAAEELDLLRYIRHRHVTALRYGCIDDMNMYIFMDLMDLNFHDFIHNNKDIGPYFEREMIFTLLGAARGIAYLHSKNLIHRDIKPANVLMKVEQKPQGIKVLKVRIADFGISKQLFQARETMTLIGTPVYMAREMFMGSYDAKVDVYSFGVMIAEAICRRLPRQSEPFTLDELYIHTEDNIVMRALVKVQQNCIQPLPEARPSMEQVVSYLEDIILEYYSGPT